MTVFRSAIFCCCRRAGAAPCGSACQSAGAYLPAALMSRPEETGLFGPLSQAIDPPQHPELRQLRHCFASALAGNAVDWRLWLGKGPGLTPSLDDMLIGMMLAAWRSGRMSPCGGRAFFRASGDLHTATTQVSVNYLRYGQRGALRFAADAFCLRPGNVDDVSSPPSKLCWRWGIPPVPTRFWDSGWRNILSKDFV
ncbi:Protein of uncharacterised function (DUF2877) [Raoultella planticola]|nr:Protein of uncharacterised function (DUF2877) [Raoultella planticola]